MRVDVRSRRAWLLEDEYEAVMERSEKRQFKDEVLFAGAIAFRPGTVTLHKCTPEQLPAVEDHTVETDVEGLFSFVEWLNGGEPFKNPLWPYPPNVIGVRADRGTTETGDSSE